MAALTHTYHDKLPGSYEEARRMLDEARDIRLVLQPESEFRPSVVLLEQPQRGGYGRCIDLLLDDYPVVSFFPSGRVYLDHGGHVTRRTQRLINAVLKKRGTKSPGGTIRLFAYITGTKMHLGFKSTKPGHRFRKPNPTRSSRIIPMWLTSVPDPASKPAGR
jgi:hypothetical protein